MVQPSQEIEREVASLYPDWQASLLIGQAKQMMPFRVAGTPSERYCLVIISKMPLIKCIQARYVVRAVIAVWLKQVLHD